MPDGRVIAIVDDNEPLTRTIAKVLTSGHLAVEVFHTGESFLQQASRIEEFGCILLDLRLPDLGGLEILSAIQDLAGCPSVLILTGHGDVPVAVEAMKMGVVDFMQKPFSNETLLEAVNRAMAATEGARDPEPSPGRGPIERETP